MWTRSTALFLIIALAACGEPAVGRDLEKYRTEPACREYFVSRDLDGLAGSGQDPTAALLGLFSAPCLHGVAIENAHIYRFVFQPSFEPQLVATVFAVNDSAWLWSFRVNPDDASDDAWDAATVRARSKESVRHLTSSEWREIQDQVEHSNFWGQAPIQYLLIEDGAFWTIEGWRDDQYNMTRGTDPSNECRDLFRYIIELD